MKKIKLLTSLVGLTGLSMGLVPAIVSCSCSTGLQVELVSKKKDRIFNKKTNGVVFNFKLSDYQQIKNIKVKLVNLKINESEAKTVAGLIKLVTDSAGNLKVVINTTTLLTQWPDVSKATFDLQFINKINKATVATITDFNLGRNVSAKPTFSQYDWAETVKLVDEVENGDLGETEFAQMFSNDDGEEYATINDFVGTEKILKLNGVDHKFRIIGVNHDTLVQPIKTRTTALFTLQSFTLLQEKGDDENQTLRTNWDSDNTTYWSINHESVLYQHLNSTNSVEWYLSAGVSTTSTKSVYSMLLDTEVTPKQVIKQVATTTTAWSTHDITSYNCFCFPLTIDEMGIYCNWDYIHNVGKQYQYWKTANMDEAGLEIRRTRIASAITQDTDSSSYIDWVPIPPDYNESRIGISNGGPNGKGPISFAFCI